MSVEGVDCPIRKAGLCSDIIRNTEQVKNLTAWQRDQNGHLKEIKQGIGEMGNTITAIAKSLAEHVAFHLGEEQAEALHRTGRRWSIQMTIMLSNVIVGLLAIGVTILVSRIWR